MGIVFLMAQNIFPEKMDCKKLFIFVQAIQYLKPIENDITKALKYKRL